MNSRIDLRNIEKFRVDPLYDRRASFKEGGGKGDVVPFSSTRCNNISNKRARNLQKNLRLKGGRYVATATSSLVLF